MSDFTEALSQDFVESCKRELAIADANKAEIDSLPPVQRGILADICAKSDFQPNKGHADVSGLTDLEAKVVEAHIEGGLTIGAAIASVYGMYQE